MDKAVQKKRVALYSVIVGIFLTGFKLVVGLLTGSLGILSEALHSLLDLGAALITFFAVRFSIKPPDSSHQYGHGKIENLSALAEAILLLVTCIWIVYEAIKRLATNDYFVEATIWSFLVMGVSVLLDIFISRLLSKAAKKYSSQALEADGLHYSSDILSSSVVIIGLIGVKLGVPALDPIAALGVAILVTIASIRLGKRTIEELLDEAPKGLSEQITKSILANVPELKKIENIRVRRSGSSTYVDLVVCAQRLLSIDRSHELADKIEAEVKKIIEESDVLIHFHPCSDGESLIDGVNAIVNKYPEIQDSHDVEFYKNDTTGKYICTLHVRLDDTLSLDKAHEIIDNLEEHIKKENSQIDEVTTHIETSTTIAVGIKQDVNQTMASTIQNEVMKDDRIKEIHDISLHKRDSNDMICCHIVPKNQILLAEAHEIATIVEGKIKSLYPEIKEVVVHTEPFQENK